MDLKQVWELGFTSDLDFRAKATFGVATAALLLLFPIAIVNFFQGHVVTGIGSTGIVLMLALSVWRVSRGQNHQSLILFGLVIPGMLFMISVFQYDGIVGSLWCFPSIVACYCMLSERRAWLANVCILGIAIPMAAVSLPPVHSVRVIATFIAISVFSAILVRVIDQLNSQLQFQLVHDPLTGLYNRLTLKDQLERSIECHNANGLTSSLLAIDVDHFKGINDRYGHDIGDAALVALARVFRQNLRAGDHAFRTGGEEFLVLLNGSSEQEAYQIAERLRRQVEVATIIEHDEVTVSIGATHYDNGENWTQWVKRADNFLYEAKRLGRNRVAIASKPRLASVSEIQVVATDPETGTFSV